MRRTGRTLFTLALTALLATEAARASSEAPVRIGFLEFPPFSYLDAQQHGRQQHTHKTQHPQHHGRHYTQRQLHKIKIHAPHHNHRQSD